MSPSMDLFTKISLACGLLATLFLVYHRPELESTEPAQTQVNTTIDTSWRYTPYGWQDSSQWNSRVHFPKPLAAQIHPFLWTAMVVLAVIGVMVWSSNEVEVDSLVAPSSDADSVQYSRCNHTPRCKNFCLDNLMHQDISMDDPAKWIQARRRQI